MLEKREYMRNSIVEQRIMKDGLYQISLTLNEKDYFTVYEDISENHAKEIMDNYLVYRQDDGQPDDIKIKHNKNQRMVTIHADLHYTGNTKTIHSYETNDYVRKEGEMRIH